MKHTLRKLAAAATGALFLVLATGSPAPAAAPAWMGSFSNESYLHWNSPVAINFKTHSGRWLHILPDHNISELRDYTTGFYVPDRCHVSLTGFYPDGRLFLSRSIYGGTDWFGLGPNRRYELIVRCW